MTAHLSGSDRQALRLAHELREELRQALPGWGISSPAAVSPFVDSGGSPSVIVRLDAESARALAMMLAEQRARMQPAGMRPAEPYPADPYAAAEPYPADPYGDPRRADGPPMQMPYMPETVPPPHR